MMEDAMHISDVISSDGVRLHVREWGPSDAKTILFIHGWSQSFLSWSHQFESSLANEFHLAAFDLRGHGMSDCPLDESRYTSGQLWADDVAAIIEQRDLDHPVLVGWSFGGYVSCDYVRAYGQGAIGGINFVDWAVMLGNTDKERALAGRGFEDYFEGAISDDFPTNIAAMRGFVRACVEREPSPEDLETLLCFNIIVPPLVRRALTMRGQLDNSPLLSTLTIPVLVTQGLSDQVTSPAAADHIQHCYPSAQVSRYEGVGHSPFMEEPDRFNRELAVFVRDAPTKSMEHAPPHALDPITLATESEDGG
jgi:non-heme chloroperoxidase